MSESLDNYSTFLQFREGSHRAFQEMYHQNYKRLLLLARRFTGSLTEAEDIVADAFVRLWNQRQTLDNMAAVEAFLFNSVKFKCYDFLRHATVKKHHHAQLVNILEDMHVADFSVEMVRLELVKMIYEQAEKLPDKMKEIFLMTYQLGMKPAEIAQALGLSVKTVKNQRLNAIQMLKKLLNDRPLLLATLMMMETGLSN